MPGLSVSCGSSTPGSVFPSSPGRLASPSPAYNNYKQKKKKGMQLYILNVQYINLISVNIIIKYFIYLKNPRNIFGIGSDDITLRNRSNVEDFI